MPTFAGLGVKMRFLDRVKLISDKYEKEGAKKGDLGNILEPEIRYGAFFVVFHDKTGRDYAEICADVFDLEFVEDAGVTDEELLNALPKQDPRWWCIVQDGFVYNLKGEKKNKIPYVFDS